MRIRRLVTPRLQLKLTLWFACLGVVALVLQFLLFTGAVNELVFDLPGDSTQHYDRFVAAYSEVLLISFAIVLPLTILTGIVATFRIAGPALAIERFLEAVKRGEDPGPCRLRDGDELQRIAQLVDELVPRQGAAKATGEADPDSEPAREAA